MTAITPMAVVTDDSTVVASGSPPARSDAAPDFDAESRSCLVGSLVGVRHACAVAPLTDDHADATGSVVWEAELVAIIAEAENLKHALAGLQARATDELRQARTAAAGPGRRAQDQAIQSVAAEVGLARRASPWWGGQYVAAARLLPRELPHTWGLLLTGQVSETMARGLIGETACLSREDRAEVDGRLGPHLPGLTVRQACGRARRIAAELDNPALARRHAAAVQCRRVTVRPAPDGKAYLTVLGPMAYVIGAHTALTRHAITLCAAQLNTHRLTGDPQSPGAGDGSGTAASDVPMRTVAQIAADTALELLSGRTTAQPTPVAVHLLMTDRALLGTGDSNRSVDEPAWLPGHGVIGAPAARAWLADPDTRVWLRRLYTRPSTGELVGMDSKARAFTGQLRQLILLRDDQRCSTPWCDAPARHIDHTERVADGGPTTYHNAAALCERCNHTRETPGWQITTHPKSPAGARTIQTPTRTTYTHQPPPITERGG